MNGQTGDDALRQDTIVVTFQTESKQGKIVHSQKSNKMSLGSDQREMNITSYMSRMRIKESEEQSENG